MAKAGCRGVGRRWFIGGVGAAAGTLLAGLLDRVSPGSSDGAAVSPPSAGDGRSAPAAATVNVRPPPSSDGRRVDPRIFGKLLEHNGRDVYPGIYSDHLANGSFEVWNRTGPRTAVIFDVDSFPGVAYGWEPVEEAGTVGFEHATGGVHGRRAEPDLESGAEMAPWNWPWPRGVAEPRFQRVYLRGRGGVRQSTALPDRRTRSYDVEVSVRGAGVSECAIELRAPDGRALARETVPVGDEWARNEVELALDDAGGRRYRDTPFGTYALAFVAEGDGRLDLDWSVLRSGDAIRGRFNPTTVRRLREFGVASLRWPGGNFASQYRWRDGVGPPAERPVVPNCNWGGLERNALGTNEFLEFCDLVGAEPLVTVGSWVHVPPEEAADWVEYCNGSTDTEMGALRAEHGYPDPWDVAAWQVGNEVWGVYQVGHTDAGAYADRYERYREAMTAVDPSIEVDAAGIDPMYTDYDDGSALLSGRAAPPSWNEVLFDRAGTAIRGLDVHRYSRGIKNDARRWLWRQRTGGDPIDYSEVLVSFPTQFGRLVAELCESAAAHGVDDLRVNVGEWNLQPRVGDGWPRAGYPTVAHAAYVAGMYNEFVGRGDAVRLAYQRDNTLFSRPYPIDTRPVTPGNYVQRFYAEPFADGGDWRHLALDVEGPRRTIPRTGTRVRRSEDVPVLDATAVRSAAGRAVVFAVNRDLRDAIEATIDVGGGGDRGGSGPGGGGSGPGGGSSSPGGGGVGGGGGDAWSDDREPSSATLTLLGGADGDPFARRTSWDVVDGFELTETTVPVEDGSVTVELPPAGVARLVLGDAE